MYLNNNYAQTYIIYVWMYVCVVIYLSVFKYPTKAQLRHLTDVKVIRAKNLIDKRTVLG